MKDKHWDYILQLSVVTGEEPTVTRFEQKSFIKSLDVALLDLISLDLPRFGRGDLNPRVGGLRYEQGQIIYQPTGETVAITRHYDPRGKFFPAGPGLYLDVGTDIAALEKTLDIDLKALSPNGLPTGILKLGHYQNRSVVLSRQSGLDVIVDRMMERQFHPEREMFQLEINYQNAPFIPGAHLSYNFDTVKDAMKALADQDLSQIGPLLKDSIRIGEGIDSIGISRMEEPLVTLERYPPFLTLPWGGEPGFYYVAADKHTNKVLTSEVDLTMLPQFKQGKTYYYVASLGIEAGKPTFHPNFQQFKERLAAEHKPVQRKHPPNRRVTPGQKGSSPSL